MQKGYAMAAIKWIKTAHKGLRFYEHPTRKHGRRLDRYYAIRFKVDGKDYGYGIGWWSEGVPAEVKKNDPDIGFEEYALTQMKLYKAAVKTGQGPKSPKERRKIEKEREAAEQEQERQKERESVTFGEFFEETYLPQVQRDKKPHTAVNEEGIYRRNLSRIIGALPFPQISAIQMERIKKDMGDAGLSSRTVQYALQIVRQVFNVAKKRGVFTGESPTGKIKWPKIDNMKMRYLSTDEADRLLEALGKRSQTVHDMALLSLHTGLRFSEIANLRWSCVNWDAGTLAILNAKTGSRTAYLTDQATEMLRSRDPGEADELVFKKRSGRKQADGKQTEREAPMVQASKIFADTVDSLGLNDGITDTKQKVTFHSLRHSYATHLYETTGDLYLVQKSIGHETSTMTQRYAKMTGSRLKEAAKLLGEALARKNDKGEKPAEVVEIKNGGRQ